MTPKPLNERIGGLAALAVLMAMTRFHHEGTAFALPDASLAVFFLAGFHASASWMFLALLAEAFAIDYVAIAGFGVSDYCVSPAYVFLVPTYGVMWLAGRWLSHQTQRPWGIYAGLAGASLVVSATCAFLVSNGSFFWFSGKVSTVSLMDYAVGLSGQYPPYVGATALYAALGLGVLRGLSSNLAAMCPHGVGVR